MEAHGINFIRECVPTAIEEIEPGTPGKLKVGDLNNSIIIAGLKKKIITLIAYIYLAQL